MLVYRVVTLWRSHRPDHADEISPIFPGKSVSVPFTGYNSSLKGPSKRVGVTTLVVGPQVCT
jgi:hypothetical protein